jgi:hypothetical protein
MIYDDNRKGLQAKASGVLADLVYVRIENWKDIAVKPYAIMMIRL